MPRVQINKKKYKVKGIGGWVTEQLFKERKSQTALSEALDTTQQAVSYKIRHNTFSYGDLLTLFEFFNTSYEEILYVMRL